MKYLVILFLIITIFPFSYNNILADNNFIEKLACKILLRVESHGEAWYVNPFDYKRYYLGKPKDAFNLMRNLGVGITNNNLAKFPVGLIDYDDNDDDNDGLTNRLEVALGIDKNNIDSDNDGYNDLLEIQNNYNPHNNTSLPIDIEFTKNHLGKIFIQTEKNGEAWYINTKDQKRYYGV